MSRFTQEISIIILVLLCLTVVVLLGFMIYSRIRHIKIPVIVIVLFVMIALVLSVVIISTVLAGNNHPVVPPESSWHG